MNATGPTLWTLLVAIGFGLIRFVIPNVGNGTVQAISVRFASLAFLAAGTVGASGWIGEVSDQGIQLANKNGAQLTAAVVGAGVIWIIWLGMAFALLLTWLPETWFKKPIPDWLSISGLFLPTLMAYVPGSPGDFFGRLFDTAGSGLVELVAGWIS